MKTKKPLSKEKKEKDTMKDLRPQGKDFLWSGVPFKHDDRKRELLKKYGKEIGKLMGPEPKAKYVCLFLVTVQLSCGVLSRELSWPMFFAMSYFIGGIVTHALFLAIHEVTHGLAFRKPFYNDLLAMFCNIGIGVPYAIVFKNYHAEHHRYQGWDGVDVDVPAEIEAKLMDSRLGKLFFVFFQILFYALRPGLLRSQKITFTHVLNWIVVLSAMTLYYSFFGPIPLLYILVSDFMAGTVNPVAGHFLTEHYLIDPCGEQETFSYYGYLNYLTWNVGYHNEHHDFPNIPFTRIAKLKAIAPEFYEPLVQTPSWIGAMWKFVFDDRVSLWCRVKRERDAGKRMGPLLPTNAPTSS